MSHTKILLRAPSLLDDLVLPLVRVLLIGALSAIVLWFAVTYHEVAVRGALRAHTAVMTLLGQDSPWPGLALGFAASLAAWGLGIAYIRKPAPRVRLLGALACLGVAAGLALAFSGWTDPGALALASSSAIVLSLMANVTVFLLARADVDL